MASLTRYRFGRVFAVLLVAVAPGILKAQDDIEPSRFSQPGMVEALSTGDFDRLSMSEDLKTSITGGDLRPRYVYAAFQAFKQFSPETPGECWKLQLPGIEDGLLARLIEGSANPRSLTRLAEQLHDYAIAIQDGRSLEVLLDSAHQAGSIQTVDESAVYDMRMLLSLHDCESRVTKRVLGNIAAYALGTPPILSPAEAERQANERREAAQRREKARQDALRDGARSRCVGQFDRTHMYDRDALCGCIVGALDTGALSDTEWTSLGTDFRDVVAVSTRHGGMSDQIVSCLDAR